ncbi:hypothetical protein [Tomitella gaofuii]|uniref:hypothetical protein n=1 Tax=Tomitella gaofuii TaxID=2760083 RepID=UPI0015FC745A|nr:hypothetical protein [Tomitella gaofuii]
MADLDLAAIRRRIPSVPREDMSLHERDRADLLAVVARVEELEATLRADVEGLDPLVIVPAHGVIEMLRRALDGGV